VRVHDVAPIRDAVRMIEAIGNAGLSPQSEEG
jgi:dihydropteroate synthase